MESKPRLKIPLNRIARAGEKDSSIDATAFTKTSRQKDARDREISTLKKVNPCFFLVAKPEAPGNMFRGLLSASILRDSYLKDSIYPSLNRGARNSVDMAGSGLIRHSTVAFTCSQHLLKITDPRIVSQAQWAEKHFHYGHRERGGTVAISNSPPNESLSMISCRQTLGFALPLLQNTLQYKGL